MKQYLLAAGVAAIAVTAAVPASAVTFTTAAGLPDGPFLGDFRLPEGINGDTGDMTRNYDGNGFNPAGPVEVESSPRTISQFDDDGIGVIGGVGDEIDNLDGVERLHITIPAFQSVTFGITDLFDNPNDAEPEIGGVTVFCSACGGGETFYFEGGNSLAGGAPGEETGVNNGEQSLIFDELGTTQNRFEFFIPAQDDAVVLANINDQLGFDLSQEQLNELLGASDFSIAVVTPLPAAVWMFGAGLAGVAGAAYRRRAKVQAQA